MKLGCVDGPIPEEKLREFLACARQSQSKPCGTAASGHAAAAAAAAASPSPAAAAAAAPVAPIVGHAEGGVSAAGSARIMNGLIGLEQGVVSGTSRVPAPKSSLLKRRRVVTGFGSERTDDARGDQDRRDQEALQRAGDTEQGM